MKNVTIIAALLSIFLPFQLHAQSLNDTYYDIGTPTFHDVYVDPVNGNDGNSGESEGAAYRTLNAAWESIPQGSSLTTGVRVNILPGTLQEDEIPNYLEYRYGTYEHPIIFRAANGPGTVTLAGDLNVFDTHYFYLIDLTIAPNGDAFHCELCNHILIRGGEYDGGAQAAHETIKINQSQYIFIEDANIHGADDNAIDFVAVQYGHIIYNRIHNAADWCAYVKGGSDYIRVEGNEIFDCGTGGFTAGQGSGGEFMTSPWLHYEAEDIKVVNNVIHDTEGAGLGVNGGYNVLLAHNTLYRIGSRSHTIEVVYGFRSCDGDLAKCNNYRSLGGWQDTSTGGEGQPIGNRNVFIYNNVVYNPAGFEQPGQIFAIYGPRTPSGGTNLSSPQRTDTNLVIRGNMIWSNPGSTYLGIEESDQGCQSGNSTCNEAQLLADNSVNTSEPELLDPNGGDFRPVESGHLFSVATFSIPTFSGGDRPAAPVSPQGELSNLLTKDRGQVERTSDSPPGAYFSATSTLVPPGGGGSGNGGGGGSGGGGDSSLTINSASCTPKRGSAGTRVRCTADVSSDVTVSSVMLRIGTSYSRQMRYRNGAFRARFKAPVLKGRGRITAEDSNGNSTTMSIGRLRYK